MSEELDPGLARRIDDWKAAAPAPRADLRDRIVAAAEDAMAADSAGKPEAVAANVVAHPRWLAGAGRVALAAAATLLVALLAVRGFSGDPAVVSVRGNLLVNDALQAAHEAEQRHAEAIAALQRAAEPVLALAGDPGTSPADAALLMSYRDRLSALDTAIAEVRAYLDDNPGLASARTVLLAAYIDKTQTLEEVLEFEPDGERG